MNPRQRELLEDAAGWRLIALLFECPTAGWHDQVAALAAEIADPDLRAAAAAAQSEASEGVYHSIFGPGGPAPPREVSHRRLVEFGGLLSELQAHYNAFAYQPRTLEPADHISVEAGFIAYLRLKEAYALACDDTEHAAITAEAAQRFLEDHLAALATPLAAALAGCGFRYLECAAKALHCRVPESAPALPLLPETEAFCCPDSA
jgi:TorA maturation chaperone TorD